ncbi:MAG: hypothetical protein Q9218_007582, partial [Villophora microphyllina]
MAQPPQQPVHILSRHRPSSDVKWDPYEVLGIDRSRTACYGWAPSKNRSCGNPIASANREEAQSLLCKMSRLDLGTINLDRRLETVAQRLLCRHNHQEQTANVVLNWKERIADIQVRRVEVPANIGHATPETSRETVQPLTRLEDILFRLDDILSHMGHRTQQQRRE